MPSTAQLISELGIDTTMPNLRTILTRLNAGLVAANALYVSLAANYSNATITPSDLVTGTITMTGGDLLIEASGFLLCIMSDNNALVQALADDFTQGLVALYIDGVAVNHASCRVPVAATLVSGAWEGLGSSPGQIFVKVTGLAPGAHTIAVKASLLSAPPTGAILICNASATPLAFGYNLRAVEI